MPQSAAEEAQTGHKEMSLEGQCCGGTSHPGETGSAQGFVCQETAREDRQVSVKEGRWSDESKAW